MAGPIYAQSSGTGTLYIYQNSNETGLLTQTSSGTLGYIVPSTGTVYVVITGITETAALGPSGCGGTTPCTYTNIRLQWNGYTETLANVPVTKQSGACPGGASECWTAGPAAWTVGTFGSSTGVSMTCGTTGIVIYGQDATASNKYYYTTADPGGPSSQGHFFGAGTSTSGTCATAVPEFPLGPVLLFAVAIPALILARRSVRVTRL